MENNKYFTPDIEDLCIGYELELLCVIEGSNEKEETWKNTIIYNLYVENKEEFIKSVRVPYLTKEQIEAEGWKLDSSPDSNEMHFIKKIKKSRHYLEFYPNTKEVIINKINTESLPFKCKDINTFRKIIKLLEI
jgi:hypothetical protein